MHARKKNVLLIIETSRGFGRGLLRGISDHALEHGEWIVHVEDRGLLEAMPSWIRDWKGDGIIARTSSMQLHRAVRRHGVPVVELLGDGHRVHAEVHSDEDRVAFLAVEHFYRSGFTNFGFFGIGNAWWSQLRQEAFEREVLQRGGNFYPFPAAGTGPRVFYPAWESDFNAKMLRWLRRLPRPTAIWAVSDALAIRLIEGCRRVGIAVPEEMAILGTTNDILLCNVQTPPLSSVDLSSFRMGYVAAERLAKKMASQPVEEAPVRIPPMGVVTRQSTDATVFSDTDLALAVRFIRENAVDGITVDEVALHLNMSRSTLQRRFRRGMNHSVEREIMRTRMDRARRLLRETNLTLTAIATRTGFATADYFVQAFRRENECTPDQYRRRLPKPHSDSEDGTRTGTGH